MTEDPFAIVEALQDNWDGEGAPRPNAAAIKRARGFFTAGAAAGLEFEVDVDVLGGMALMFYGRSDYSLWVACFNSGQDTIVGSFGGSPLVRVYPKEGWEAEVLRDNQTGSFSGGALV